MVCFLCCMTKRRRGLLCSGKTSATPDLWFESLISKFATSISDLFLYFLLDFTNKQTGIFGGSLKH